MNCQKLEIACHDQLQVKVHTHGFNRFNGFSIYKCINLRFIDIYSIHCYISNGYVCSINQFCSAGSIKDTSLVDNNANKITIYLVKQKVVHYNSEEQTLNRQRTNYSDKLIPNRQRTNYSE